MDSIIIDQNIFIRQFSDFFLNQIFTQGSSDQRIQLFNYLLGIVQSFDFRQASVVDDSFRVQGVFEDSLICFDELLFNFFRALG